MGVSLKKGEKVSLTKENGMALHKIRVGLGWAAQSRVGADIDIDSSVFLTGVADTNGKSHVTADEDFIYFNNKVDLYGAVVHHGDDLVGGDGTADCETVDIDLSKLPEKIEKVAFVCNIYEALERNQNFGMVSKAFIRIIDAETDKEILRYDLAEDFSLETAIEVGVVYRHNGEWKFNAVGTGQTSFRDLVKEYGVNVA